MGLDAVHRARRLKVGGTAKAVLTWLAVYADDQDPGLLCWPSVTSLASDTEFSRRSILRALSELERRGVISRRRTRGSTTAYSLHLDAEPVSESHQCHSGTGDSVAPNPCHSDTQPVSESHPDNQDNHGQPETPSRATRAGAHTREAGEPPGDLADPDGEHQRTVARLLLKDGSWYEVTAGQREHWQSLFPGVDVQTSLGSMQAWCETAPGHKRKTRRGIARFITSWLNRDVQQGRNQRETPDHANVAGGGQPAGRRAPPEGGASVANATRRDNYGGSSDEAIEEFERRLAGYES